MIGNMKKDSRSNTVIPNDYLEAPYFNNISVHNR